MSRFGTIGTQYFDNAGNPLVSGKLYFYESGTTTAKTTYADSSQTIANTNPVVLSASGRQPNIFYAGLAKVILTKDDGTQIEVRDPVGEIGNVQLTEWDGAISYENESIVIGSDGKLYKSLIDNNLGQNPTLSTAYWSEIVTVKKWNAVETYTTDDVVLGSNGILYTSNVTPNLNNNPVTDFVNWSNSSGLPSFTGNAGLYARVNSGETAIEYADPSVYKLISTSTISNNASVVITLPTGYKKFAVEFVNVYAGATARNLIMAASTNGGSTYYNTSGNYHDVKNYAASVSTSITTSGNITSTDGTYLTNAQNYFSGTLFLYDPLNAAVKTCYDWHLSTVDNSGPYNYWFSGSGMINVVSDIDAIKFTLSSAANLVSGEIRLYGIIS